MFFISLSAVQFRKTTDLQPIQSLSKAFGQTRAFFENLVRTLNCISLKAHAKTVFGHLKPQLTFRLPALRHVLTQFQTVAVAWYHMTSYLSTKEAWSWRLIDRLLSLSVFELSQNSLFFSQFAKHAQKSVVLNYGIIRLSYPLNCHSVLRKLNENIYVVSQTKTRRIGRNSNNSNHNKEFNCVLNTPYDKVQCLQQEAIHECVIGYLTPCEQSLPLVSQRAERNLCCYNTCQRLPANS